MKYIYSLYLLILLYNQIQLLFSEMVTWTDAELECLSELKDGCADWGDLYAKFCKRFPGNQRTIEAIKD